mmetsp:Transcript_20230/g.56380  ORF Transcript_20230/g.56380 Transcript_20230/m.56380 type:complete len:266 (+) Transcript_20230:522-1319(+)
MPCNATRCNPDAMRKEAASTGLCLGRLFQLLRDDIGRVGTGEGRGGLVRLVGVDDDEGHAAHTELPAGGVHLLRDLGLLVWRHCGRDFFRRHIHGLGKGSEYFGIRDVSALLEVLLVHDLHETVGLVVGVSAAVLLDVVDEGVRLVRGVDVAIWVPLDAVLAPHLVEGGVGIPEPRRSSRTVLAGQVLLDGLRLGRGIHRGIEVEGQPLEGDLHVGRSACFLQVPQHNVAEGSHDVADHADPHGLGCCGCCRAHLASSLPDVFND